jgi:mRNA interferase RelE/StbE
LAWTISFDPRAERDLLHLDRSVQRQIIRYLETRVAFSEDPILLGKPLSGSLAGLWRYRVENHRVVCQIQREQITVLVVAVGHRKDIYKKQ